MDKPNISDADLFSKSLLLLLGFFDSKENLHLGKKRIALYNNKKSLIALTQSLNMLKYSAGPETTLQLAREIYYKSRLAPNDWKKMLSILSLISTYIIYKKEWIAYKKLTSFIKDFHKTNDEYESTLMKIALAWEIKLRFSLEGNIGSTKAIEEENYNTSSEIVNYALELNRHLSLSDCCMYSSSLQEAQTHLGKALKITRKQSWALFQANILLKLGSVDLILGSLNSALIFLEESLEIYEEIKYRVGLFSVYKKLVQIYLPLGNIKKANHNATLMLKYYLSEGMSTYYTGAYTCMGELYLFRGKYDDAITELNHELIIANSLKDKYRLALTNFILSRVFRFKNNITLAIDHLQKSYSYFSKMNNKGIVARIMIQYAQCSLIVGDIQKAEASVVKAKEFSLQKKDLEIESTILRVEGCIEREKGEYDTSLYLLSESQKKLNKTKGSSLLSIEIELELAKSHEVLGDTQQAVVCLIKAVNSAQKLSCDPLLAQSISELERLDPNEAATMRFRPYLVKQALKAAQQTGILEDKPKRLFATVLFVDIRGFTSLSENLDIEELGTLVNEYLELMSQSVLEFGGEVNKFIGDAVMGLWLDDIEYGKNGVSARHAIKSGIAMIEEINLFNIRRTLHSQEPIEIGVGISSGVVVAGFFGSRERKEYSVLGDVVNTASRLEGQARSNIYISEMTKSLVKDINVEMVPLDPIVVKGKKDPVKVWSIGPNEEAFLEEETIITEYDSEIN